MPDEVAALRPWSAADGGSGERLYLWCPGCDDPHAVEVTAGGWTWDRSLDAPTISPSILVTGTQWAEGAHFHKPSHNVAAGERTVCHSFVVAGRWQFLGDCTHRLAGQTVPLPALPDWLVKEQP